MTKVGIGNVYKDLDKMWVGVGGVWKEVEKAWVGVGGVWKEVDGLKPAPFVLIFTSSQNWTVPSGVTKLTVTLIPGGVGGSMGYGSSNAYGGVGGRASYTKEDVAVAPDSTIPIVIGAGGVGETNSTARTEGGFSSFGSVYSRNPSGSLGYGGTVYTDGDVSHASVGDDGIQVNGIYYAGGGGGGGARATPPGFTQRTANGAKGGNRGGGNGGLLNGTGSFHGADGVQNTGGGGGGGFFNQDNTTHGNGGSGGSGIVIIEYKGEVT